MNAWPLVELSKVADASSGDGAPQEASAFGESGTPFIRAGSLVPLLDGTRENQLELIPEAESSQRRMRTYPAHAIVFAKSGMSCTKGLVYELTGPAHVVNHLAALECGNDLHPRFLLRWFQMNSPARLIANPSYPSIKISSIRSERVPLPPLAEQKRIARILDTADALRAKRRKSLAQIDTLLQSTFLDMFGNPVTNPMGWDASTIGEVTTCLDRLRKPIKADNRVDGDIPYYGANGQQGWISESLFDEPLVLVAEDGGHFDTPERGVAYRIDGPAWVNNHAHVLRALGSVEVEYLHRALRHYDFSPHISGSTRAKLNQKQLNKARLLVPPINLQRRFAVIVASVEKQKATQRAHLAELDTLFASLQSRAFRGDL